MQEGYTPEDIEADRRYLTTHCPVPRNDYPSKEPITSQVQSQDPLRRANTLPAKTKTYESDQKYLESIRRNPNNPEAHYQYGCHLFDTKRLVDAKREFDICLNINPQHGKCHRKYSELLGFMGKIQDAQMHYQLA